MKGERCESRTWRVFTTFFIIAESRHTVFVILDEESKGKATKPLPRLVHWAMVFFSIASVLYIACALYTGHSIFAR